MSTVDQEERRRLELLAGFVLGDLSEEETEQVGTILVDDSAKRALFELERTAAAVQLSLAEERAEAMPAEAMPTEVAQRIRAEAEPAILSNSVEAASHTRSVDPQIEPASRSSAMSSREFIAWFCAAAAVLMAAVLWRSEPADATITAATLRAEMLASGSDLVKVDWTPGKTPFETNVAGDVVWDANTQTGFMRFVDMPVNDPTVEQYQLWIIDPQRDDEPIDGGVFDISQSGEVIVEIDAKLKVIDPAAFAITIEKPGGVVVSTQERLPLLAAVAN